jgi:hypothetical protein
MHRYIVKLVMWLLKSSNITLEDRNTLTTAILDKLTILPMYDIIKVNENGQLLINNRIVDLEKAKLLRESAMAALNNQSLKAVHEQVLFNAITMGVHNVITPDQMFFSRAAIWYSQQEIAILKTLAQQNDNVIDNIDMGN